jgi:hypothetical protein
MKRILVLFAVCSLQAAASSVSYTLSGQGSGFTLVTPDFLPNLVTGQTSWSFSSSQLAHCDLNCSSAYLTASNPNVPGATYIGVRNTGYRNDPSYLASEGYFATDLAHVGTWTNIYQPALRLTVSLVSSPAAGTPVATPEPAMYWSTGAVLAALFIRRIKSSF